MIHRFIKIACVKYSTAHPIMKKVESSSIGKELNNLKITPMNNKEKTKQNKITLKTAKGTRDYDPHQMAIRKRVLETVVKAFEKYGAECIDTPVFELKDILVNKYGEDGGKLIYDLQDQGGEILALRYDLTVPFARYLALNSKHIKTGPGGVFKRYQIGKVYRRDNPSFARGRLREFYQCDFDIAHLNVPIMNSVAPKNTAKLSNSNNNVVNDNTCEITESNQAFRDAFDLIVINVDYVLAEVECLRIVIEIIKQLGFLGNNSNNFIDEKITDTTLNMEGDTLKSSCNSEYYKPSQVNNEPPKNNNSVLHIKVNHRSLLESILLTGVGVASEAFTTVCSTIDKMDKMSLPEIRKELIYVKGLNDGQVDTLFHYVTQASNVGDDLIDGLLSDTKLMACPKALQALKHLQTFLQYARLYDITPFISLDLSLARGLDYYTGLIFEATLTTPGSASNLLNTTDSKEKQQLHNHHRKDHDENSPQLNVGSIAGGGRYDNLVESLETSNSSAKKTGAHGKHTPCVGFSLGLERIFALMEQGIKEGKQGNQVRTKATDVFVMSAQKHLLPERIKLCLELWNAGINAEHALKENPKILTQFQYCEDFGIPFAIVIGESELQNGTVKLRDIASRVETTIQRHSLITEIKKKINDSANLTNKICFNV